MTIPTDKVLEMAREAEIAVGLAGGNPSKDKITRFAALIQRQMIEDGWRQCAEGQGTTQYCGIAEELLKDAERYRWLREQCAGNGKLTIAIVKEWELLPWSGDDTDAAIDRARSANDKG